MLDRVFRKKEEIVARKIAGEIILVPVTGRLADMKRIFSLNEVAGHIWDCIDGTRSLGDIVGEVVAAFEAGREEAEADVLEFIAELQKEGMIEEAK